jgi:hypothetical protein
MTRHPTVAHDFIENDDGTLRGVLVHVQAADRIAVWTGGIDPVAARKPSVELDAQDFSARTVVHFVAWEHARAYYAGSPYARMIESLRQRMVRFSTIPASTSTDDPTPN